MKMIKKNKVKKAIMECKRDICAFKNKGCRTCSECGVKPDFVSDNCQRCFDCEYKEGSLRWDNNKDNKEENKSKIVIEMMG